MSPKKQVFTGQARVFECEEDAFQVVRKRPCKAGDAILIRNKAAAGRPGMQEMPATTAAISGQGMGKKVALITDSRFAGAARGFGVGHVRPVAAHGGPIVLICEGDLITIHAIGGDLSVALSQDDFAARRTSWSGRRPTQ
jgi:dihydroxy-acid dehydratase